MSFTQQLANLAIKGTNERRYFTGIEGDRERKGELFGLENLFSYRAEGASLSKDILNRTEKLEAGYEVAKYQIAHEKMREDRTLKEVSWFLEKHNMKHSHPEGSNASFNNVLSLESCARGYAYDAKKRSCRPQAFIVSSI